MRYIRITQLALKADSRIMIPSQLLHLLSIWLHTLTYKVPTRTCRDLKNALSKLHACQELALKLFTKLVEGGDCLRY